MAEDLSPSTIRRMVELVEPAAELQETTPAEAGFSPVSLVTVETDGERREWVLKAAPDEEDTGVATDARIQALLGARTSIPVPTVLGVVDEHPALPTPFYLMEAMPGSDVGYEEVGWLADDVLRTTSRQIGAALGELHRLDAVESFGLVTADPAPTLTESRPSGSVTHLGVLDGEDTWEGWVEAWVDRELDRHADSPFDDLTPALEDWCRSALDAVARPHSPVLGRNDHGFHNLLIDRETGDVTAMLDWAYTLAVSPSFDFEYAAYLFSGAFLSGIPEVPDRRELVRAAMLEGYRATAPDLVEGVASPSPLYELLAAMRVMNDFEQLRPRLPDGTDDAVTAGIRDDVASMLDREPVG